MGDIEEARKKIEQAKENGGEYLLLNRMGLTGEDLEKLLPEIKDSLPDLRLLYLVGNNIDRLPDGIGNMGKLESLDLSNNFIKQMPDTIVGMEKLERLYLSDNKLTDLPEALGRIPTLNVLNVTGNPLTNRALELLETTLNIRPDFDLRYSDEGRSLGSVQTKVDVDKVLMWEALEEGARLHVVSRGCLTTVELEVYRELELERSKKMDTGDGTKTEVSPVLEALDWQLKKRSMGELYEMERVTAKGPPKGEVRTGFPAENGPTAMPENGHGGQGRVHKGTRIEQLKRALVQPNRPGARTPVQTGARAGVPELAKIFDGQANKGKGRRP